MRWLDFNHAEQQWLALRCWISSTVLLRDPPQSSLWPPVAPEADSGTAAASAAGAPRWPHACGHLPAELGAPPVLVPLEEVASALALVGFTAALQANDVMDSTLSGVIQVRCEVPPVTAVLASRPLRVAGVRQCFIGSCCMHWWSWGLVVLHLQRLV